MTDPRIMVEVRTDGTLRATAIDRDTREAGPETPVRSSGLHADLIRLFEGWLRLRDREWREVEIRTFGTLLHRFLFGEQGWDWIDGAIRRAAPKTVRLELVFPADGEYARLAAIPWEYLYRPEQPNRGGAFLAAEPGLVLSRFIHSDGHDFPPESKVGVLVVISQPNDPLLGPVLHKKVLAEIRKTAKALNFSLTVLYNPTAHKLHEKMFTGGVAQLVHFMGHGQFDPESGEASLALSDPSGAGTDWVSDRRLASILTRGSQAPRAVILHACEGGVVDFPIGFAGLAPQLIRSGVQSVVAMQYPVTNETASAFSTSLYRQLAAGREFDLAVQDARWNISQFSVPPDPSLVGVPVVYLQSHAALVRGAPEVANTNGAAKEIGA